MKAFTITHGRIENYIQPILYKATNGNEYPVVAVGESHRGSKFSFVPIHNCEIVDNKISPVTDVSIASTKSGKPLLQACKHYDFPDECLVVFTTPIGFRGYNEHTGGKKDENSFYPFPGEILAEGIISQGTAGRMGAGHQLIAVMPIGLTFRTFKGGRTYGSEKEFFYRFDGETIRAWTRVEEDLIEL